MLWREALAFRDALRRDRDRGRVQEALKRRLAIEFRHDREAYSQAKGPFVIQVVQRVLGGGLSRVTKS